MALDRSSAVEISATSMDMAMERKHGPTSPDVPNKKKKFAPLKSLKRLFAGNKKKKTKDDVQSVGMKSTSCDVLEAQPEEGSSQLPSKNTISMSADSVFSGDRPRDDNIDFTRSMEVLPGSHFKDELARKLQGRRSDDDEGLPSSPPAHTTTVDALIESGLKEKSVSMESERSWMSLDSSEAELEDFFGTDWASSTSHLPESLHPSDVDLDVVASTTSLNVKAAKHKIAVKPKARSSALIQRRRMASPMATAVVTVLPKLKEEPQPNDSLVTTQEADDDVIGSQDETETTDEKSPTAGSTDELTSEEKEEDGQEVSMDISDKTGLSSEEDELKESPTEISSEENIKAPLEKTVSSVVLRNKQSPAAVDSSKRLTIAGESVEVTPFGERRVKRSSLLVEEKVEHTEDSSEFASVFARFKKQASQKKVELDKKAAALEQSKHSERFPGMAQKEPLLKKASGDGASPGEKVAQKTNKPQVLPTDPNLKTTPNKNPKETVIIEKKEHQVKSEKKEVTKVEKPQIIIIEKSNDVEKNRLAGVTRQIKKDAVRDNTKTSTDVKYNVDENTGKGLSGGSLSELSKDAKATSTEVLSKNDNHTKIVSSVETSPDSGNKSALSKPTVLSSKYVGFHQKSASTAAERKSEDKLKVDSSKKENSLENKAKEKAINKEGILGDDERSSVISAKDKVMSSASSTAHKRDSPRLINRLRSQTLPDSTAAKDKSSGDSLQVKRTSSQDTSVNKENIPSAAEETSSRRPSVIRSAGSGRPTPQKLITGNKPSWIEMARKRTEGWDDEDKNNKEAEDKKTAAEIELAEKRASVFDLVKRFQ